jgi:hypothetical protein
MSLESSILESLTLPKGPHSHSVIRTTSHWNSSHRPTESCRLTAASDGMEPSRRKAPAISSRRVEGVVEQVPLAIGDACGHSVAPAHAGYGKRRGSS